MSPINFERLWDTWCCASIIGIWPRFIEPNLIFTSKKTLVLPYLSKDLEGLRIVQISDLHYSRHTKPSYCDRIVEHIKSLAPHVIVFTGDFISYSELYNEQHLLEFLQKLKAPFGSYAIFGNHDYSQYVSLAENGSYRIIQKHIPPLLRGFMRLFSYNDVQSHDMEVFAPIPIHEKLQELIQLSGFHVLHNETVQIGKMNARLNLTGLGDIMSLQCQPEKAFRGYDYRYSGIVLSHNPDSYELLSGYPGDVFLFGHTHGGQVNLPFIWKKITPIRNKKFKKGLFFINSKYLYINRGLGATFPFRWFAPPEITLFTLVRSGPQAVPVFSHAYEKQTSYNAANEATCSIEK